MGKITLEQYTRSLQAAGKTGLRSQLRLGLRAVEAALETEAKGLAGQRMKVRSGKLRHSITAKLVDKQFGFELTLGAGGARLPYARIQEFGGTIVPRVARWLRIPLPPALTGQGLDRYPGRLREVAPGEFHIRRSKAGRFLLFRNDDRGGPPWYVLKDRVTLPARFYLRDAVANNLRRLDAETRKAVRTALEF